MNTLKHKLSGNWPLGLALVVLLSVSSGLFAAKGGDEKGKKGYVLKFNGFSVQKTYLTPLSLIQQQGATYRGSISPMQPASSNPNMQHSIITYQRGNTIFIYPLQQKGLLNRFKTPDRAIR